MKSVLMVTYYYPPDGSSSGVLRPLKFSKYLPGHGWKPQVLTLAESFYPRRDDGLRRDVPPEAVIHRTRGLDTVRHLSLFGLHPGFLAVPDRFIGWLPFGVARGLRVIRSGGVHAIWSTSPPPISHLIAAVLRRRTGVPWVADFRDPWVEDGLYPTPGSLRWRIESRLEGAVVRSADRITVTTPYLRGDFLRRYPDLDPDRIQVIYNGYDEADFARLPAPDKSASFEILHAGLVARDYRDPVPLLEAVAALLAAGVLPRGGVRVSFLGGGAYLRSADFEGEVRRLGLGEVVRVEDRIPNADALRRIRQASCLLLLQASDDTRSLIPAKAFEYLRAGRPILALVPDGATSDLLTDLDHCFPIDPSETALLQRTIAALHAEWRATSSAVTLTRRVERFERARLTAELAGALDALTGGPLR